MAGMLLPTHSTASGRRAVLSHLGGRTCTCMRQEPTRGIRAWRHRGSASLRPPPLRQSLNSSPEPMPIREPEVDPEEERRNTRIDQGCEAAVTLGTLALLVAWPQSETFWAFGLGLSLLLIARKELPEYLKAWAHYQHVKSRVEKLESVDSVVKKLERALRSGRL